MGMNAAPDWAVLPLGGVASGPRYLVIHLPAFRLERCGWSADDLVALVAERRNATRLVALTLAARAQGLHEDMTAAEARARVAEVVLEPFDEAGERADAADLVRAFEPLADRVAPYGEDDVLIEISQTQAFYGGEDAMLARVRARAQELGHVCRLAVADHPLAARVLARHGMGDTIVPVGQGAQALAPLPFEALDPSPDLAASVQALGLRTLGAWARLDPASVAGRFGDEGLELHRVARGAVGPVWADLPSLVPLERLRVPVDDELEQVDAVVARARQGLERLREQLAARDRVVALLELRLELAWGDSERVRVRVATPTRSVDVLERLLRDRLSRLTLTAPVRGLLLHAAETVPDGRGQQDLLERGEGAEGWSELVARLSDVLGEDAVFHPVLLETWRPEAAWVSRPLLASDLELPGVDPCDDDPVEAQEGSAWTWPCPRPTLLRHPPQPLRVDVHDGRPRAVRARQGWSPIRRARGPERLEGHWWHAGGGFARDYWVVELPGGTAWVFQERDQWFLHGWFD